jgi:general secretion pathway protein K
MRADVVMKRARSRRKTRGVALIMVLLSVVTLAAFLVELQQESSGNFAAAIAARDRLVAEYHARSAVNLARLLIATEPTVRRTVQPIFAMLMKGQKMPQIPVWEFASDVLGAYNCPEEAEGFSSLTGVDATVGENLGLGTSAGCFQLVIVDEDSKVNVNTAARLDSISHLRIAMQLLSTMQGAQNDPMFEDVDADGQHSDRAAVCGALIDWADGDENLESCDITAQAPTSQGVEDNYYQTIGLDYFRKNAAYDSLEELRLVRGVSDDFWATFVDPDPLDPESRVMTVWGQGAINVNTANAQTLLVLVCTGAPDAPLCTDPVQIAAFLQIVTLAKSMTAGAPLFGSGTDFINTMKGKGLIGPLMAQFGVQPVTFKSDAEMKKMVTTRSKVFSIYADGVVPAKGRETRASIHAVIDYKSATALEEMAAPDPNAPQTGTGRGSTTGTPSSGSSSSTEADAALQALTQNPMGQIVYWRVR